jgi:hypothetical protein
MRRFTLAAALLVLAACAGAPTPGGEPAPAAAAEPMQLYIPVRVGHFVFSGRRDYDDPANGTHFRYIGPDSVIGDIFVYPGPDFAADCNTKCALEVLQAEVDGFRDNLSLVRKDWGADSLVVVSTQRATRVAGDLWQVGHRMRLRMVERGRPVRLSDFHLFMVPGSRFKVRITYPDVAPHTRYADDFTDLALPSFAAEPVPLPEPTRANILRAIEGEWDWSSSDLLCGPGRHTIKTAPDGNSFTITFPPDSTEPPTVYTYRISAVGPGTLTDESYVVRALIDGEDRMTPGGKPVEWDLVMQRSDIFSWHRTDWDEDGRTPPVVRCDVAPRIP